MIFRPVIDTGGSVLTSSSCAGVVFVLASNSSVCGRAGAIEVGAKVSTESSVHARTSDATLRCSFTSFTVGSLGAPEKQDIQHEKCNHFDNILEMENLNL